MCECVPVETDYVTGTGHSVNTDLRQVPSAGLVGEALLTGISLGATFRSVDLPRVIPHRRHRHHRHLRPLRCRHCQTLGGGPSESSLIIVIVISVPAVVVAAEPGLAVLIAAPPPSPRVFKQGQGHPGAPHGPAAGRRTGLALGQLL